MGARAILCCRGSTEGLNGECRVPGDKSISQRAVILAAMAHGRSEIRGFLEAQDSLHTLAAVQALGAEAHRESNVLSIHGCGKSFTPPSSPLDLGNSGTGLRLLMGALAGTGTGAVLDGDTSLRCRPMERIARPLRAMGAVIESSAGGVAPVTLQASTRRLQGIEWELDVASAQLKSALLLAGLNAEGVTTLRQPGPSRDHTERMLATFGVHLEIDADTLAIKGGQALQGTSLEIPGDLSAAAFIIVAAAISPEAEVLLSGVGLNPTRRGVLDILQRMGARIDIVGSRTAGGEPVADIRVRGGADLEAVDIRGTEVVRAIDEIPILCIAAACARGTTRIRDAAELRLKESDRLSAMASGLAELGIEVKAHADGIDIVGRDSFSGGLIESRGDHRVAMAFAVAAQRANGEVRVLDPENIDTSFPDFSHMLSGLGMRLHKERA